MNATIDLGELRARAAGDAPPAGGRSETLTFPPGWASLPGAAELAALLARAPIAELRFAEPVDFAALSGAEIVRVIALLRECSSIGARISWSLTLGSQQVALIRKLDHLPAPDTAAVAGRGILPAGEWRSSLTFGLLYFRKGPDFVSVIDRRPESSCRIVMDDAIMLEVFFHGLEGCAWTEVTRSPEHAAAAQDLASEGLLLRVADHCVSLPVHMRSWPIPALDL